MAEKLSTDKVCESSEAPDHRACPLAVCQQYEVGCARPSNCVMLRSGDGDAASDEKPVAWLIVRYSGTGKGADAIHHEVVLSPLTDEHHMDEGDEAWPLYKRAGTPSATASPVNGEMLAALRDLRHYLATDHGIGGVISFVPQCPKCDRIKSLDDLIWKAQSPQPEGRAKDDVR